MVCDTPSLHNAYDKFGNVAHVEGWYKAECFTPSMRIAQPPAQIKKFRNKTDWYLPIVQLDYRKAERLKMTERLDACLITKGRRYPEIFPATALELEKIARKNPKNDWRVEIIHAFESLIYQRQGRMKWVLIEIGKGYA